MVTCKASLSFGFWTLFPITAKICTPFGRTQPVAAQSELGIVSVNLKQDYSDKEVFELQIQGLFLTNEEPVKRYNLPWTPGCVSSGWMHRYSAKSHISLSHRDHLPPLKAVPSGT